MDTTIYYFSGTGNSLKVAKDISERLGSANVISISSIIDDEIILTSPNIGFVFPVYVYGLPLIVSRFIKKINTTNKNIYFFAIATCRNEKGGAILQIGNLLKGKGLKLTSGFSVYMPGNYIYAYETDSMNELEEKFMIWKKRLDEIVTVIKNKDNKIEQLTFTEKFFQSKILYPIVSNNFKKWDKRFWTDNNCNGCGTCKKVCPVKNIVIKNNKPIWLHKCEQCVACLNWCPKASIQYTKKTVGRERYHNPYIKLVDMISKRC